GYCIDAWSGPAVPECPYRMSGDGKALILSEGQEVVDDSPSPVYSSIIFQVGHVDHVFVQQNRPEAAANSILKSQTQSFLITGSRAGPLQPAVNASYGPLSVDAPITPDLLLSGYKIQPVILTRQVRSSSPVVKILFHMSSQGDISVAEGIRSEGSGAKSKDGAHCVTAYAFWETREVRGACWVSPGGFCVAQLKPEPAWFSSSSRSGSSSGETGRSEGVRGLQGNQAEVYFQSRSELTGPCTPQDSLQRLWVGRARAPQGSGTPMRRIGSVTLLRTPPGNPTYLRLRLGGAVVIQTSSKPLKTTDVATFYIFLAIYTKYSICHFYLLYSHRGLLEVLQLDFVPSDIAEHIESQMISWRLEIPGNVKDVGLIRMYTAQRDYVGLAPLNADVLNTAVLTGKNVSVPVKTLAVEADGSVTDVTKYTSCTSMQQDVLKVSERCDYVYVDGKETMGRSSVMVNFTYGFLSAQLEMRVWMPRLPMTIQIADPELSQIKGWRVPITTGRAITRQSYNEEEEEMRKGRGCMLQYQHSPIRVLTPFIAQSDAETLPVDVTSLVHSSVKVADPEVARVSDGVILQGRAVGTTTVMVVSPVTSSVLAERTIRVVDDKVSVTELGVQLVSGLSLSLQLSPEGNRAIVATATIREVITQLKQEAVVTCWVHFSDGAVVPLDLFERSLYSLSVSTPDDRVATVRRTPQHTFVLAQSQGEGQGALVRVELRICEDCQKSKRKSKLVVGTGLLQINFPSNSISADEDEIGIGTDSVKGSPSEVVGEIKTSQRAVTDGDKRLFQSTVTDPTTPVEITASTILSTRSVLPHVIWISNTSRATRATTYAAATTVTTVTELTPKKDDLIRTFRSMSDIEIGMYALVGVSCVAILAFLLNCASYTLCFRNQKTPIQAPPPPPGDPKDHKHDWVWLGSGNNHHRNPPPPGKPIDPMANRSATLLSTPHRTEPLHSPTSKRNQVQFTTFTTLDINYVTDHIAVPFLIHLQIALATSVFDFSP
uniref:Uncharacterized protein n=1 Tax=Periophthalmus magnuspinnatus TaxID=409849 RepID=A0A3B4APJ4_9GOBI